MEPMIVIVSSFLTTDFLSENTCDHRCGMFAQFYVQIRNLLSKVFLIVTVMVICLKWNALSAPYVLMGLLYLNIFSTVLYVVTQFANYSNFSSFVFLLFKDLLTQSTKITTLLRNQNLTMILTFKLKDVDLFVSTLNPSHHSIWYQIYFEALMLIRYPKRFYICYQNHSKKTVNLFWLVWCASNGTVL